MREVVTETHHVAVYGRNIEAQLFRPEKANRSNPAPGILYLHEIYGVIDGYVEDCRELASLGYAVLLPDLYAGMGGMRFCIREFFTQAGLANTSANPALGEVFHVLDYLETIDGVDRKRIGALGACLTGGFILHLAKRPELKAPVVYHHSLGIAGAGIPPADAAGIQNTIQGHYVPNDLFCPRAKQEKLQELLGTRLEHHLYQEGHHGLRSRDRNTESGRLAWERTKAFFAQQLSG